MVDRGLSGLSLPNKSPLVAAKRESIRPFPLLSLVRNSN